MRGAMRGADRDWSACVRPINGPSEVAQISYQTNPVCTSSFLGYVFLLRPRVLPQLFPVSCGFPVARFPRGRRRWFGVGPPVALSVSSITCFGTKTI